jgi:hypothetical protein
MSDKAKPGKDKDLRYIRQAMEATDQLFTLLGERVDELCADQPADAVAEALLLLSDQLDQLSQMVEEPACSPASVIEQNRQVRGLVRALRPAVKAPRLAQMAHAAGNQLRALLVVKEIRGQDGPQRPFSMSLNSHSRKQREDVLDN